MRRLQWSWLPLSTSLLSPLTSASASDATASSSVSWCTNPTSSAVLTSCGDNCDAGDPCVQFRESSSCSEASRNDCERYSPTCMYQCLDAYNSVARKFTVFIKEPAPSDTWTTSASGSDAAAFPSAAFDTVTGVVYTETTRNMYVFVLDCVKGSFYLQITGFDDTNVQKGALKAVTFDANAFATATVLEQLILTNLDLQVLPTGFLPTTVSLLTIENCNLASLPSQLGNLANKNLVTLNLNKNTMTGVTDSDSSVTKALQGLTTLDLSHNKLTEFPAAVFNMTNLNIL
uniref:RxLR effector candidate protein n=1 Tax=Hyaloperonospora arabidopsidis (strain Emoy2) TaxID=559515 RepID=M4C571_HYAAE